MWYSFASYAALLALSVALARYYNPQLFDKLLPRRTPEAAPDGGPGKKQKNKRTKLGDDRSTSTPASGSETTTKSKKRKVISAPVGDTVKATTTQGQQTTIPRADDGDISNREFAQQLAKAQAGTSLEKHQAPVKKGRRAARAALHPQQGVESPSLSANTSSTGDRDADDDVSPNGTPPTGTPSTAQTSGAGDVSDMLEPRAAAPTTLRLTDVAPTKPKQAPKQFEQVLTKKQRQRQADAGRNKQLREESDRKHEAKKQEQLRTARIAAGTSNQTKANTFSSTPHNVWQKKPEVQPSQPERQQQPLLDTFEPETPNSNGAVSVAPLENITNGIARNETANAAKEKIGERRTEAMAASGREGRPDMSRGTSWADEVNEDAQDEWVKSLEANETWEPVASKKSKKKNKDTDTSSDTSAAISRREPTTNGVKKEKGEVARPQNMNRFASMNGDAWEP